MGTSLIKPGDKAVLRADRNHLIRCRFGARFAGLVRGLQTRTPV